MVLLPLLPGGEDLYNVNKIVQLTNVPAQVFIFLNFIFFISMFFLIGGVKHHLVLIHHRTLIRRRVRDGESAVWVA